MAVEENIKENEFLFTNRKRKVVLDGDGNVKQENKRKKKIWRQTKIFLTFEIGSALSPLLLRQGEKRKVEFHNKLMTVEENMITIQN